MRRTVATLLVVASPLLVAVPVGAAEGPAPGRAAAPAAAAPAVAVPAAPVTVAPATVAPGTVTAPTAPALPAAAAVERATAVAAAPVRPETRAVRHVTPRRRDLDDAAYAARLQADLCQARTIFCGLDRSGHYPAS